MTHFRRYRVAVCATTLVTLAALASDGCSAKATPFSTGVLSTVQQRVLTEATDRAFDEAGINAKLFDKLFGKSKIKLTFDTVGEGDLGRKHVQGLVENKVRSLSGGLDEGGKHMHCSILLAGVDVTDSGLGPVYYVRRTKGDVHLRFSYAGKDYEGHGSSTYEQKWLVGANIKDDMAESQ